MRLLLAYKATIHTYNLQIFTQSLLPIQTMNDEKYLIQLGKRIREKRMQQQLSQDKLSALCDMEKANLSRIEAGKTNATILTLRKIGKILFSSLAEMFED